MPSLYVCRGSLCRRPGDVAAYRGSLSWKPKPKLEVTWKPIPFKTKKSSQESAAPGLQERGLNAGALFNGTDPAGLKAGRELQNVRALKQAHSVPE